MNWLANGFDFGVDDWGWCIAHGLEMQDDYFRVAARSGLHGVASRGFRGCGFGRHI